MEVLISSGLQAGEIKRIIVSYNRIRIIIHEIREQLYNMKQFNCL
jgi:hypothetical protein